MAIASDWGHAVEIMGVQNVCLQSEVQEDVYVMKPSGYAVINPAMGQPLALKLKKSLYGLRQSPGNFSNTFVNGTTDLGVRALRSDPCVYIHNARYTCSKLSVYAGGCIIYGQSPAVMKDIRLRSAGLRRSSA